MGVILHKIITKGTAYKTYRKFKLGQVWRGFLLQPDGANVCGVPSGVRKISPYKPLAKLNLQFNLRSVRFQRSEAAQNLKDVLC